GTLKGTIACTFTNGKCELTGLYSEVAMLADISVTGYTGSPTIEGVAGDGNDLPQIQFNLTTGTVKDYQLATVTPTVAWDGDPSRGSPHSDTFTIYALDGAGNRITNYDSQKDDADFNTWLSSQPFETVNSQAGFDSTDGCGTYNAFANGMTTCD